MTIEIEVKGLTALTGLLTRATASAATRAAVEQMAIQVSAKLRKYPPKNRPTRASVYGRAFKNAAQRRAVMAKMREEGPYRRTRTLGQTWTTRVVSDVEAVVGNATPYARWVMGDDDQSKYMAAVGWRTVKAIVAGEEQALRKIGDAVIADSMRKAGLM